VDYGSLEVAKDLAITRSGQGAYLLDVFGGVLALGTAKRIPSPYFGVDIASDIEVVDGGYYILTTLGDVYPVGDVASFTPPDGLFGTIDLEVRDGGGYVITDSLGIVTSVGVNAFSVDAGGLSIGVDAADFSLLDSRRTTDGSAEVTRLLDEFEASIAAEDRVRLAPLVSVIYNDGTRKTRDDYLNAVDVFFAERLVESFSLGAPVLSADWEAGKVVATTARTLVSSVQVQVMNVIDSVRSGLYYGPSLGAIETRNRTASSLEIEFENSEDALISLVYKVSSITLFIDRREIDKQNWEPATRFSEADIDGDGTQFTFEGGYRYRFFLANNSTVGDPYEVIRVEITRESAQETTTETGTEVFSLERDEGGSWFITSSTFPPKI
jgi:hypothetical protein